MNDVMLGFLKTLLILVILPLSLSACDGSAPDEAPINVPNTSTDAPVFTSSSSVDVAENSSAVITVSASTNSNATLLFEISGGVDSALFSIDANTGDLSFNYFPDFEVPRDSGNNNVYNVIIRASDGVNEASQALSVVLSNIDDNVPEAANLTIEDSNGGNLLVGDTLVASYQYMDIDGDIEGASVIQWYSNGLAISAANSLSYTIIMGDSGLPLHFEVIPFSVDSILPGVTVSSSPVVTFNSLPVASFVIVSGDANGAAREGDVLTGSYNYSDIEGDLEAATTLRWLRDGVAISGETGPSYTVVAGDLASVIQFQVTPFAQSGSSPGFVALSSQITIVSNNRAPVAGTVVISGGANGSANVSNVLTGSYIYTDIEGDGEAASRFRWLRDGVAISGESSARYTITNSDLGARIQFEVTPASATGSSPGLPVRSSNVLISRINNLPVASSVVISGDSNGSANINSILNGSYVYSDAESDLEGQSSFRWLRDGVAISGANSQNYTPVIGDIGTVIRFEVTPVSNTGTSPGLIVLSSGVSIVNSLPLASSVIVTGDSNGLAIFDDILIGSYVYSDLEGDVESGSRVQWLRDGVVISAATGNSYTILAADLGAEIRFSVTPASSGGNSPGLMVVSAATLVVAGNIPPEALGITILGDVLGQASQGDVLTGGYTYSDTEGDVEGGSLYVWLRDDVPISAATNISYSITSADINSLIRFQVTPVSPTGTSPGPVEVSSGVLIVNGAPIASSVAISGDTAGVAIQGDVLTGSYIYSDPETDPESGTLLNWLRGGVAISGANSNTYTLVLEDVGSEIRFQVTPGSSSGNSPGLPAVSPAVNAENAVPVASSVVITGDTAGNAGVTDVLTASYTYTDAEGDAEGASTYRWLRDGSAIGGETGLSYTIVIADIGAEIRFEVTPVSVTGTSPGLALASSSVIIVNSPPVASSVAISGATSGVANVGDALTGGYTYSDVDGDAEGVSTFRWLRGGAAITGETSTSYTVSSADAGNSLSFEVTPVSVSGASPGTPVVSAIVTVPVTTNLCMTNENGVANKLGVRRYIRFSISASQSITIEANKTSGVSASDPDLQLYKNGVLIASAASTTTDTETLIASVTPGEHVLEVLELAYNSGSATPAETCHDVSITYGAGSAKPSQKTSQKIGKATSLKGYPEKVSSPKVNKKSLLENSIIRAKNGPSTCSDVGEIIVSGALSYERVLHDTATNGLDYSNIQSLPIRSARVETICDGAVYDVGLTDVNGNYSLTASDGVSNFIRVKAQLLDTVATAWDFQVVDNTNSGALYAMDTASFIPASADITNNSFVATSGWGGTSYTGPRTAAPFAVLDSVYLAFQEVLAADAAAVFPALNINWSINNTTVSGDLTIGEIGTSFYNGTGIYILGAEDSDTDEYDDHVIIHEWAHYFEDTFSRSDSIGGSHSFGDILDARLAFGEGFGNAYSGIASNDPNYRDSSGAQQAAGFGFDVSSTTCTNAGWYSECSIQSLLYDFDGLLTFTPIYNVLINEQKNTSALTSVFSFVKPLKDNNSASSAAIETLVTGQSIDVINDIYGDSELNNNPGATNQLPIFDLF